MPDITITITINDSAVRQLLAQAPQRLDTAVRGGLEDSGTLFVATMKNYPPQRAGSTYRRTNTLMRSWSKGTARRTINGWSITVGSNANMTPYNRRVQSRAEQAPIHRGRWLTAESAIERDASRVQGFMNARIRAPR